MSMINSNDTIGNRNRDLPVCSAVPQPTAPPAACPSLPYKRQYDKEHKINKYKILLIPLCSANRRIPMGGEGVVSGSSRMLRWNHVTEIEAIPYTWL